MKIAVCYSGMFRNLNETLHNHRNSIFSKYDCDIYMSFWDVYGVGAFNSRYQSNSRKTFVFEENKFIESDVNDDTIRQEDIDYVLNELKPVHLELEKFSEFEPFFQSKEILMNKVFKEDHNWLPHLVNVMSMYYKIYRSNELVRVYGNGKKYDCILRFRSDLMFVEAYDIKILQPKENTIYINNWGTYQDSHYNDMILYGDEIGMKKYADMYFHLERVWREIGRSAGNEHLLAHYLKTIPDVNINRETAIEHHKVFKGDIKTRAGHYHPDKN